MWWKKNKWKVIVPVLIVAVLAGAFYYGGGTPGSHGWNVKPAPSADGGEQSAPAEDGQKPDAEPSQPSGSPEDPAKEDGTGDKDAPETPQKDPAEPSDGDAPDTGDDTPEDPGKTEEPEDTGKPDDKEPEPEPEPVPEPEPEPEPEREPTCTISISCTTILDNIDLCDPDKVELVPSSGWILGPVEVTFTEGETVFDVLQRTCREYGIHLEYVYSPTYGSVYIEGIYNLYQFDVGELSGWMYSVNGWFPNYGSGLYPLEDGDVIRWVYTCDLGYDVGGGY